MISLVVWGLLLISVLCMYVALHLYKGFINISSGRHACVSLHRCFYQPRADVLIGGPTVELLGYTLPRVLLVCCSP